MKKRSLFTLIILVMLGSISNAQQVITEADKLALEGIIVEKYHVATEEDYTDTTGIPLPKGAVTYRIYVDMRPGYNIQLVYGNSKHELRFESTTVFFNNDDCGALVGYNVNYKKLNLGSYAFDSWITLNSATDRHAGILLADDTDGSIINKKGFEKADGLTNGNLPVFKPFNIDFSFFKFEKEKQVFSTRNGGWAAISGVKGGTKGPTKDNRVLVAQLTTTGKLSFELNVQIGTPEGGILKFVAQNPEGDEIKFNALSYK